MVIIIGAAVVLIALWRFWVSMTGGRRVRRLCNEGIRALEAQDWAGAEKTLAKALKIMPISTGIRRLLARAYAGAGQIGPAEAELRTSIEFEPRNADAHLDLAILLAATKRHNDAIDSIAHVLEYAPEYRERLGELAELKSLHEYPRFVELLQPPDANS